MPVKDTEEGHAAARQDAPQARKAEDAAATTWAEVAAKKTAAQKARKGTQATAVYTVVDNAAYCQHATATCGWLGRYAKFINENSENLRKKCIMKNNETLIERETPTQ